MKKDDEMRSEYDFTGAERGKFYGKIKGVGAFKGKPGRKGAGENGAEDFEEINTLFHKLWSKAEGQEGYVKSEWKRLGRLLNKNNIPV